MPDASYLIRISALSVGLFAQEVIAAGMEATAAGSTSRGIFLLTSSNQVVFLSYETWRGPLTVNLATEHPLLKAIPLKTRVQLAPESIHIPDTPVVVDLGASPVWTTPPTPPDRLTAEQRMMFLQETARLAVARSAAGFGPVLAAFLALPDPPALSHKEQPLLARLTDLQRALASRDDQKAGEIASGFIGYGRGLTPCGDDLVCGFLLTLNRWAHVLLECDRPPALNKRLSLYAYAHTTALSANLIAAAAAGQADERLLQALDALFSGELSPNDIADRLLAYGSSSGVDALTGFALALSI